MGVRFGFPLVRLARDDSQDAPLVGMLRHVEPDLMEYDEPMAFPIYGRGRALYALIGAGINEDTIGEACLFLVQGCSCLVKEGNPGRDLLLAVDWGQVAVAVAGPGHLGARAGPVDLGSAGAAGGGAARPGGIG